MRLDPLRLRDRYPATFYLAEAARRRMPYFAWEYLASGTGVEAAIARNHAAMDGILLEPRFLRGFRVPELSVSLFGRKWNAPLGVAPVGLAGLMWPQAELILARAAAARNLPYCLSMVACETPEAVGPAVDGRGWFQLYPVASDETEADIMARAGAAGFEVLVVTVDVPINSTRERQRRAGVTGAGGRSVARMLQVLARPAWAIATARRGAPSLRTIARYVKDSSIAGILDFIRHEQMGAADEDHLKRIRDRWKGPLVVKGVLDAESAALCRRIGVDGIVVSNHGGRQLDAVPAAIDVLPGIVAEAGHDLEILFDSGIRTGLDIARALALGARFTLSGRAFMYGVGAAGEGGAGLVADLLVGDLSNNMMQIGAGSFGELPAALMN